MVKPCVAVLSVCRIYRWHTMRWHHHIHFCRYENRIRWYHRVMSVLVCGNHRGSGRHIDRYLRAGIQLPHTFQEARKHQTTSGIHQGKRKGIRNTSDQCMGTSGRYQYRQCKMQHSAGGFLSQRSFHCHRDLSLNRLVIDPLIVSETKKNKETG